MSGLSFYERRWLWEAFGTRQNNKAGITPYYRQLARATTDPRLNMPQSHYAVALGTLDLPTINPSASRASVDKVILQHVETAKSLGIDPGHYSYGYYGKGNLDGLTPKYIHRTELWPEYANKQATAFSRDHPALMPTMEYLEWLYDQPKGSLSVGRFTPGWGSGTGSGRGGSGGGAQ